MRLLWGGYHYSFYHLVASTGWRIHPNHTADKWQSQNGNPKDPIPAHMLLPTALQYTGKLRWTVREKKLEVENLDVNFSSTSTSLLIIPWSEKTVASAGVWPWSHSLSPGPIFFLWNPGSGQDHWFSSWYLWCTGGSTCEETRDGDEKGVLGSWDGDPHSSDRSPSVLLLLQFSS